jgi:hypothetical protein
MDAHLRILRIIHIVMLAAAFLYVLIAEMVLRHPERPLDLNFYRVMAVLTAVMIGGILLIRQTVVGRALETLRLQPDEASANVRWRAGYTVIFALSEAIVLYGLLLRLLGATAAQAAPFYAVGIILLLLFSPRRPR